ncbi:MAG: relaxase domain-containing protein [Gammaproteobacteria bacterium]|nr:relaxase domain-containing protein [Gammaproteobacteria bacterium]
MMSISSRTAAGAVSYYVHMQKDESPEDYYAKEGVGTWHGTGALALGLAGDVDAKDFANLCAGWSPAGAALSQNAGDEGRRAGWDLTYSAPKSVSIVWGLGDEHMRAAMQRLQDRAVRRSVGYLQNNAIITRRGSGGAVRERGELAAAMFSHGTSREQDMQMHTHVFLFNAARRADGTWGTLETQPIYEMQKVAGAMYRAELAAGLRDLGFGIEADGDSFRVSSVPPELEKEFSTRRQQILDEMSDRGVSGAEAAEIAALSTRKSKEILDPAELRQTWLDRAATYGFEQEHTKPGRGHEYADQRSAQDVLKEVTEHSAVVRERDIAYAAAVAAQHAGRGADAAEALAAESLGEAVTLRDERGNVRYTTAEMIAIERAIVDIARAGQGDTAHALSAGRVDAAIDQAAQAAGYRATDEQVTAIKHLVGRGRVSVMIGDAGTGKSTSMQVLKSAYESAGFEVVGAAPSGKAAAGLAESTGIDSYTVDSLLARIASEKIVLTEKSVLVVDEAGMIGSRHLHSLVAQAGDAGAKLILAGDPKQLQPVAAGAVLRHLADAERGVGHARLTEIFRQRDGADREAVRQLSRGEAAAAMAHYIERGQVSVKSTHKAAVREVARRYMSHAADVGHDQTIALASTNARVDAINAEIRAQRLKAGELTGGVTYDAVRATQDRRTGERIERVDQCAFATGDRVLFADNNDYDADLRRGDLSTVLAVSDDSITVKLDRGGERVIDPGAQDVRHGYAITTHRSQGMTVERAVVYASSDTSRELSYVQGSRARETTEWVTTRHSIVAAAAREGVDLDPGADRLEQMSAVVKAMSVSKEAASTLDYIDAERERERAAAESERAQAQQRSRSRGYEIEM